jgi:hypothetical protein
MITPVRLSVALSLCIFVTCGKDEDTAESTDTSSSSTDTTDATTDTGGETIPCGDTECAGNQTCLMFPQEPMCTDMLENQPCPPGTTETFCGGAGQPCCCEPPPPTVNECVDPDCEGPVDCACLVDVCIPACMSTGTANVFICENLPEP